MGSNTGDLVWRGEALPFGPDNETWVFNDFVIPDGVSTIRVGVLWSEEKEFSVGDVFYLNEVALFKHADDDYAAGFEAAQRADEAMEFSSYDSLYIDETGFYSRTGNSAYRLAGATQVGNQAIGVAKSLRVYPGDQIKIEAYGTYVTQTAGGTNIGAVIAVCYKTPLISRLAARLMHRSRRSVIFLVMVPLSVRPRTRRKMTSRRWRS